MYLLQKHGNACVDSTAGALCKAKRGNVAVQMVRLQLVSLMTVTL